MSQLNLLRSKILNPAELNKQIKIWRDSNEIIVFTNGCFDLIHLGHINYLSKAKDLGDKLIIGLNTDNSISKIKGCSRPIMDFESRSTLLASMQFVDAVVFFDEETPAKLVSSVNPDILVKGGDYNVKEIIGYNWVKKYGGKVVTLKLIPGYSSTKLIKKIIQFNS